MNKVLEIIKNNKNYFLLLIGVFIVGIILFTTTQTKKPPAPSLSPPNETVEQKSKTWSEAPSDIEIPTPESQNLPDNVAKPKNVSKASNISEASIRNFPNLVIENDSFKPDTFIVKQGDIFDVFVEARDKNYDFTQPDYGYTLKINKGETKRVQFQASAAGKFLFYCASCGGPDKGPKGYLIVAPK